MDERTLNQLFDKIISLYEDKFDKRSKPRNGEGTVLASIFLHHRILLDVKVLCLTTGIKCLNANEMKRENKDGKMLHDSHAEVLCFRAFNRYLLELMKDHEFVDEDDILIKVDGNKFEWNEDWEIGMYVSELPCGDLAVIHEQHKKITKEHQEWKDDEVKQYVDENIKTILRGKNNIKKTGVVRTKPGRFDSVATLSKSCTDKIIFKQRIGLSSGLLSLLMNTKLQLKYLILPNVRLPNEDKANELLSTRLKKRMGDSDIYIQFIDKYFKDNINDYVDTTNHKRTSNEHGVMILRKTEYVNEPLQDGVKLGYKAKKKSTSLRKNCESLVSRYSMFKLYQSFNNSQGGIYVQTKVSDVKRECMKREVRNEMSTDGWISNIEDDFVLQDEWSVTSLGLIIQADNHFLFGN